jgi:hypothetical protein
VPVPNKPYTFTPLVWGATPNHQKEIEAAAKTMAAGVSWDDICAIQPPVLESFSLPSVGGPELPSLSELKAAASSIKTIPLTGEHLAKILEMTIAGVGVPPAVFASGAGLITEANMAKQQKSPWDKLTWTGICVGGPLDEELVQQPGKTFYVATQMANAQEKNTKGKLEERWMVYHGAYVACAASFVPEKYHTEEIPKMTALDNAYTGSWDYCIWQWKGYTKVGYREKDEELFDREVITYPGETNE